MRYVLTSLEYASYRTVYLFVFNIKLFYLNNNDKKEVIFDLRIKKLLLSYLDEFIWQQQYGCIHYRCLL